MEDIQLSLSKLGDPAGSGSRKNLTLAALEEFVKGVGESSVAAEIKPLVEAFDSSCKKLRHRRNKWIAHFDLETMLGAKVKGLSGPSRIEIETALEALRKVMNCVEFHYTGSQTKYEHFVINQDGECLVTTLMQGLRYRELVKEKVIAHDDLRKNCKRGV